MKGIFMMGTALLPALTLAVGIAMWVRKEKPMCWIASLFLIVALSWATDVQAHTDLNLWFTHGPAGNPIVYDIALDPITTSVVYAGTTDGVYKSTDGGESWAAKSNGLPRFWFSVSSFQYRTVFALAVDPQNPSIVYAGTDCPDQMDFSSPPAPVHPPSSRVSTAARTGLPSARSLSVPASKPWLSTPRRSLTR